MAEQSPIDIPAAAQIHSDDLQFHYGPSRVTIKDDGYALRADPSGEDRLVMAGRTYRLVQFHLHCPAEHTFAGKVSAMELHLVHADEAGGLAVVGVMLEKGAHDPTLEALLSGTEAQLDPAGLLPADRAYVAYRGSLTTPPYAEGVDWRVLVHPIHLSPEQLARFQAIHDGNAKPVQALDRRDPLIARR